ncbi:MAG: hypothetical protein ACKV22_05060 [Bryobacteraceae bacterium]
MAPPFDEYARRVQDRIEGHYGVAVVTRDIPDPLTGDLDGRSIHVDYLLTPEERLFLLVHLFGHTVQWNTSPKAREIGQPRQIPVPEDLLPALVAYEREAAGYALALVHEVGIHDLDQWLADYSACDEAYLLHYHRTGEKKPFRSFWRQGSPPVRATAVPPFSVDAEVGRHRDLA